MAGLKEIQIVAAASILGLKPTGVEKLSSALFSNGLQEKLKTRHPVIFVPTLNHLYSEHRDLQTGLINGIPLRDFSISMHDVTQKIVASNMFPFILGGDCSILIGIMSGLKTQGSYGLFFLDAHADFYQPEKSITGQTADMDLAIVTGRGPELLTNIDGGAPYVKDEHVIHIGQRDMEETSKYGSQDIHATRIRCFSLPAIQMLGVQQTMERIRDVTKSIKADGFWIHFDTDVIDDKENPAVDYRISGGLSFEECEFVLKQLMNIQSIVGISVTIYNPNLDAGGKVASKLTTCLANAFCVNLD